MGWFFIFKRFVGIAVQPLPVVFILALAGLTLLAFSKRRAAAVFLSLSPLLLFAVSFPPLVRWQAALLEDMHRPLLPERAGGMAPRIVMVLGNGVAHPGDGSMPALSRLNDCARARLAEGVRLARLFPGARLAVSGYGMGLENCADAMAEAAEELGIEKGRIVRFPQSLDTEHEARLARSLAEGGEVALVTSAVHMPRSVAIFQAEGVKSIPAPCDFISPVSERSRASVNRWRWRPRGGSLADSEELWHECLGLAYQRLKGFFAENPHAAR